jgi:hypothetical protein
MQPFRLTKQTIHLAEQIFVAQHQIGKQQLSSDQLEAGVKALYESLENKYIVHWGCLDGNRFMGYLTQVFSPKIAHHWMMSFLCTNPAIGERWDYSKNGMDTLWRAAIVCGNTYKCTNIVYSLPATWARTTDRTQRTSRVWKPYEFHVFNTVKANELPELPFDRWVFGQNPKPYDVLLRCAWPVSKPGLDWLTEHRVPETAPTVE